MQNQSVLEMAVQNNHWFNLFFPYKLSPLPSTCMHSGPRHNIDPTAVNHYISPWFCIRVQKHWTNLLSCDVPTAGSPRSSWSFWVTWAFPVLIKSLMIMVHGGLGEMLKVDSSVLAQRFGNHCSELNIHIFPLGLGILLAPRRIMICRISL